MFRKVILLGSLVAAVLMVACQPQAAATDESLTEAPQGEDATDQPSTDGESSDAMPGATGTPFDDVQVDPGRVTGFEFEGITFSPDNTMTDVTAENIAGEMVDPNGPWWVLPAHTRFDFLSYPVASTYHTPRILVIPVANFEGYPEQVSQTVQALADLLAARPELSTMGGMQNPLPQLPPFNAAQVFTAQAQYFDFQNGSGIRYLTQYDQSPIPINNNELLYTYQGLTHDGLYYVAAIFPVSHPDLPNGTDFTPEDYEAFAANAEQVIAEVTAMLNAADPASFTPNLLNLDAMMQSFNVAPAQ